MYAVTSDFDATTLNQIQLQDIRNLLTNEHGFTSQDGKYPKSYR